MTKKSSLKTFLAGKNPFGPDSCLVGAKQLGYCDMLVNYEESDGQFNQAVKGFEHSWFCDVLDDGTAITYYRYDN